MQLILACKAQRDDGQIWYKNVANLSHNCALDARTVRKILTSFVTPCMVDAKMLLEYVENEDGTIVITLPNYMEWQQLDAKEVQKKQRKNVTKMCPTRPDQTKPDQTINKKEIKIIDSIPYQEIIDDLNLITNRITDREKYTLTDLARSNITQRWQELTGDDHERMDAFRWVHRVKAQEWMGQPNEKYLTPSTLYRPTKFPIYLKQRPERNVDKQDLNNEQVCLAWANKGRVKA